MAVSGWLILSNLHLKRTKGDRWPGEKKGTGLAQPVQRFSTLTYWPVFSLFIQELPKLVFFGIFFIN